MLPGTGPGLIATGDDPGTAPVIEGAVAPDPSKALAAATQAFEKVGGTLKSIDEAANGHRRGHQERREARRLPRDLEQRPASASRAAADGIDRFIAANEADFQPAVANLREVAEKLNATLDPQTQDALQDGRQPVRDGLGQARRRPGRRRARSSRTSGARQRRCPTTDFGQTVRRLNRITSDLGLLTQTLSDGRRRAQHRRQPPEARHPPRALRQHEPDGRLRRLTPSTAFKPILASFRIFADKIARDPSVIARGALAR